ncbi:pre-mRNA-splicing factor syf2 [Rosa sericea]
MMSSSERTVHSECKSSSNLYHECREYCFKAILEARDGMDLNDVNQLLDSVQDNSGNSNLEAAPQRQKEDADNGVDHTKLTGRKKKLKELQRKVKEAIDNNQTQVKAEQKRMEPPEESLRGISKQKWLEERDRKMGKLLDANGLDLKRAYMLDTQEMAEAKYKRWKKKPAPCGWDVFNSKTLYNAHKKRTNKIEVDLEEYNKIMKQEEAFSCLEYGKSTPKVSEEKVDKMVQELKELEEEKKKFSRRRRFHEDKDIDSINDRNEHFNKKIERAFGKYTLEIKNNLERGTALPD